MEGIQNSFRRERNTKKKGVKGLSKKVIQDSFPSFMSSLLYQRRMNGAPYPERATCLEDVLVFAFPFFVVLNENRDSLIASDCPEQEAFTRDADRALEMLTDYGVFSMEETSQGVAFVETEDTVRTLSKSELKRRAVRFSRGLTDWKRRCAARTQAKASSCG